MLRLNYENLGDDFVVQFGTKLHEIDIHTTIIVNTEIQIKLPANVYEQQKALEEHQELDEQITKAFEALDKDEAITVFGLSGGMDVREPVLDFDRQYFPRLSVPREPALIHLTYHNGRHICRPTGQRKRTLLWCCRARGRRNSERGVWRYRAGHHGRRNQNSGKEDRGVCD